MGNEDYNEIIEERVSRLGESILKNIGEPILIFREFHLGHDVGFYHSFLEKANYFEGGILSGGLNKDLEWGVKDSLERVIEIPNLKFGGEKKHYFFEGWGIPVRNKSTAFNQFSFLDEGQKDSGESLLRLNKREFFPIENTKMSLKHPYVTSFGIFIGEEEIKNLKLFYGKLSFDKKIFCR